MPKGVSEKGSQKGRPIRHVSAHSTGRGPGLNTKEEAGAPAPIPSLPDPEGKIAQSHTPATVRAALCTPPSLPRSVCSNLQPKEPFFL